MSDAIRRLSVMDPTASIAALVELVQGEVFESRECGAGVPALLCGLWWVEADKKLFSAQNYLLPRSALKPRDDGWTVFFSENQGLWEAAFESSGGDNPIVASVEMAGDPMPLGIRLDEFLLRAMVEEVVFRLPAQAHGSLRDLPIGQVQATVGESARVFPPITVDSIGNQLPGIWVDGAVLAFGFERGDEVQLWASAERPGDLSASRLAALCGWGE